MHERTKEVEGLRRLADLLRQAVTATNEVAPSTTKKKELRIRRVQRADPASTTTPTETKSPDGPRRRF
jgi:hypothetical protein